MLGIPFLGEGQASIFHPLSAIFLFLPTGVAMNDLLIHLMGDAISPEWGGRRSEHLGGSGAALGQALLLTVPAILVSGVALAWARRRGRT